MTNRSNSQAARRRGWVRRSIPPLLSLVLLFAVRPARASEAAGIRPTPEELRAGAESFARIFEDIGTYPGPFFKGKVTLPAPPSGTPGASVFNDIAWSSRFGLPVFDNDVAAIVRHRGRWIAGGFFGAAPGARARGIAEWDGVRWRDIGAGVRGATRALVSDGTTLYAAGQYSVLVDRGLLTTQVLRWDGENWLPLGSVDYGFVTALRVLRGTLYAAGQFRDVSSNLSYPLMRWTGGEWVKVGPALPGSAYALTEHAGKLVLAGYFGQSNRVVDVPLVVSLEPSGWQTLARQDSLYARVNAIESFGGKLWVAGSLYSFSGLTGNPTVAAWDGTSWTPADLNGYVTSLVVSGGRLWAGGALWAFDNVFGVMSGGVAALEGGRWEIPADDLQGRINTLAATSGRPAMAGSFGTYNFRRIDPNDPLGVALPVVGQSVVEDRAGQWTALAPPGNSEAGLGGIYGYPANVRLDLLDGEIWASGDFQFARDRGAWSLVAGVARWVDGAWTAPTQSGLGYYVLPSQLVRFNGEVYAGFAYGPFSTVSSLYRLGASGWEAVPGAPEQGVLTLAVHQGSLVVAGRFTQAGGAPAASIARFDGTGWAPVGDASVALSDPDRVPVIAALLPDGADLWAAGSFTAMGGVPASGVARWDGSAWRAAGAGLQSSVNVLAKYRGRVVAGGDFFYSGTEFTGGLASWDGAAWHMLGTATVSGVRALAEARGSLYAGGYLGLSPALVSPGIARFDGEKWSALGSGVSLATAYYGDVRSIVPVGDELWVSGRFSIAGGKPAYSVTVWNLRTGSFGSPAATASAPGIKASMLAGRAGARVSFSMEREGLAELGVFDVRGARVGTLARARFTAGTHEVEWNGRDASGSAVAPGVYFLQLRVDGAVVAAGRTVALR